MIIALIVVLSYIIILGFVITYSKIPFTTFPNNLHPDKYSDESYTEIINKKEENLWNPTTDKTNNSYDYDSRITYCPKCKKKCDTTYDYTGCMDEIEWKVSKCCDAIINYDVNF